jgi:hypothetical protein
MSTSQNSNAVKAPIEIIIVALVSCIIISCNSLFRPFQTDIAPTSTPFPYPMPSGEPLTEWRDLPIMPGAIAGEETESGAYIFTIHETLDDVRLYYEQELVALGWEKGDGGSGEPGVNHLAFFKKGNDSLIIILIAIDENTTYVLFGK